MMRECLSTCLSPLIQKVRASYSKFILGVILLLGFVLRWFYTRRGLPYLYHWDEPQIAGVALNILKTGDWNPHFFSYGSLTIYLSVLVDIIHYFSSMRAAIPPFVSLAEIKTGYDTGWQWSISHPSFYYWNRNLINLLGIGSIWIVYHIAAKIFRTKTNILGLIAAYFLAVLPFYVMQSSRVTPNIPMAFWVWVSLLFLISYVDTGKISNLLIASFGIGLAIATKYNAAVFILALGLGALLASPNRRSSAKHRLVDYIIILSVPPFAFVVAMPYALIDLPSFVQEAGTQIRLYSHGPVHPGWEHISIQLRHFQESINNPFILALVVLGLVSALVLSLHKWWRRCFQCGLSASASSPGPTHKQNFFLETRPFSLLFLSMMAYFLFMTRSRVAFHRNFVVIYPFLALCLAFGVAMLYRGVCYLTKKNRFLTVIRFPFIFVSLMALLLGLQGWSSWQDAWSVRSQADNRSDLVRWLNQHPQAIRGFEEIILAEELHFHPQDLQRLPLPYRIVPLRDIPYIHARKALFVLPRALDRLFPWEYQSPEARHEWYIAQGFLATIPNEAILQTWDGGLTRLFTLSVDPALLLVTSPPTLPRLDPKDCLEQGACETPGVSGCFFNNDPAAQQQIVLCPGQRFVMPLPALAPNSYALMVTIRLSDSTISSSADNWVIVRLLDNTSVITERRFDLEPSSVSQSLVLPFVLSEESTNVILEIAYGGDAGNETQNTMPLYMHSVELTFWFSDE